MAIREFFKVWSRVGSSATRQGLPGLSSGSYCWLLLIFSIHELVTFIGRTIDSDLLFLLLLGVFLKCDRGRQVRSSTPAQGLRGMSTLRIGCLFRMEENRYTLLRYYYGFFHRILQSKYSLPSKRLFYATHFCSFAEPLHPTKEPSDSTKDLSIWWEEQKSHPCPAGCSNWHPVILTPWSVLTNRTPFQGDS